MQRVASTVPVLALAGLLAAASSPSREEVMTHLTKMRSTQRGMMNIAPKEGEYLAGLIRELNAKRVLEIGTSNGYSGIWLALGLRDTGGRLITLENHTGRHGLAQENFKATGVAGLIDSRLTDALQEIPKLDGPFDMVFIDAWKPDYIKYLRMVLPKVRTGGIIAAHNVDSQASEMSDYLDAIRNSPELRTEFIKLSRSGISVSRKQ